MFEVRISRKAEKFINKCEDKLRERLHELFRVLAEKPVPAHEYDVEKVAGGEGNRYRIRLSSYRVVYVVYWKEKILNVMKIERKKDRTYKF